MNKRAHFFRLGIGIMVAGLVLSLVWVTPARAQNSTVLSISPSTLTASTCGETVLMIRVAGVVNLNAYDVRVDFDPVKLKILEIANGTFLTDGFTVLEQINNTDGYFRLAMTQMAATGKDGDGDLIRVVFRATEPGATVNLTINTATSRLSPLGGGDYIPYTTKNGVVNTTSPTEACPTLSPSPNPSFACVGTTSTLYIRVADVVDLYSYDATLTFEPGFIEITNVTNAGWLPAPGTTIKEFDNDLGYINIAYVPTAATPKDGNGNLIKITYQALVPDKVVHMVVDEAKTTLVNWPGVMEIPKAATDGIIYTQTCDPTAVELVSFDVLRKPARSILTWETASEVNNAGFNLYRSKTRNGVRVKINKQLITAQALGANTGATYRYRDLGLDPTRKYFYWLESVDFEGKTTLTGPIKAAVIY